MTGTAFGPQGPNYSTARPPADPKASAGTDTWFKNCSAAGAKDGTFATADFFNVFIGNLRYLVRQAGVTLDDATDTMVYQAVLSMIQANMGGGGGGTPTVGTVPYGNPTLYVRTDGNDATANGSANTSAKAFATIQAALNYAQNIWSLGGKILNIQLGNPGTYVGFVTVVAPMTGVNIVGDPANQSAYVIQAPPTLTGYSALVYAGGAALNLRGLTVYTTRTDMQLIQAAYTGTISMSNVTAQFGATSPNYHINGVSGGSVNINGNVNIQGNSASALSAQVGGSVSVQTSCTVTLVGTPAFSVGTIYAGAVVSVYLVGGFSVTATGPAYYGYQSGAFLTGGKTIPGSTAGVLASGATFS